MTDEQEADSQATDGKSPDTIKTFQERFNERLEAWKKEGCQEQVEDPQRAGQTMACAAAPHRSKMNPKDANGVVVMSVDCAAGHQDVWKFEILEAELKADLKRQAEATAAARGEDGDAREPGKAWIKVTMDVATQSFAIKSWVPTPGLGIQLAGILTAHFYAELQRGNVTPKKAILTADKKLVDPRTLKPLVN